MSITVIGPPPNKEAFTAELGFASAWRQWFSDLRQVINAKILPGTPLVMDPYAVSGSPSQAHGLGTVPDFVKVILECKTAEQGYVAGDQVMLSSGYPASAGNAALDIVVSSTLTQLLTGSTLILINVKDVPGGRNTITAANWKLIATPYLFG